MQIKLRVGYKERSYLMFCSLEFEKIQELNWAVPAFSSETAFQWRDAQSQNREINQKSDFLSAPLKLMASRMSPRASHRRHQYAILASSPRQFLPPAFFVYIGPYKYKTSAFVTGKCRLKVKSAGGTCHDGVNMESKWRIDGVFWTCAL